ncbi:MAG: amidoligase family protein [Planctomycetia bacterium]|nr:amidoligase family protein [Planctomycetia bacterium]
MNAEDLTFGVEIETTIPRGTLAVGPHGRGCDIPQLSGWKADRDPSIRAGAGTEACEFVSPVFKGSEGLKQLLCDLATIKSLGAKVNTSCGLHVHVGIDKSNTELTTKLITLVSNFEKAIYASTGTKRREQSRWCNGLNQYGDADTARQSGQHSRYHVANLATGSKPTVEFRAFAATLDPVKLTAAVLMCVGFVERAMRARKTTDWTAKTPKDTSPIHRSGEGQTAVTRLFYQLGWTKGRQPYVHGELKGEGIPELPRVKKEIMRLAKKYDTPETATPTARGGITVGSNVRLSTTVAGDPLHEQIGQVVAIRRSGHVVLFGTRRYRVARRFLVLVPTTTPNTTN